MLNDGQTLGNCGFTNQTARPQAPATVGLAFRLSGEYFTLYSTVFPYFTIQWLSGFSDLLLWWLELLWGTCPLSSLSHCCRSLSPVTLSDDTFEQLRIESFSTPPELPDVMKPQDSGSTANEQAVQWGRGQSKWKRCAGGGRGWILGSDASAGEINLAEDRSSAGHKKWKTRVLLVVNLRAGASKWFFCPEIGERMLEKLITSHKTLQRQLKDLSQHCQSFMGLV